MDKLIIFAKSIEDFRMDRKKLHPSENIVFITVLALICNATDWEEIADFGELRKEYLSQYLDLTNGIPSHDTFNRFFTLFSPEKFQCLFIEWLHELLGVAINGGSHIIIDGKSSRGTAVKNKGMLHLLNAFLVDSQCILGQQKTADKSNEITAIPKLLEVLDIEDSIISIDAIGCQKEVAEKIKAKGADYFLAVKKNQKSLYEDLDAAFKIFVENDENFYSHEDLNGSRVEKRTCKVIKDLGHLGDSTQWCGIRALVKIEAETYLKSEGRTRNETRYFISSKNATPEQYLNYSRNHWQIENNLHWSLDVVFKEDASRKRKNNVAENFSIMLKVILAILKEKQKNNKKISIKRMRKRAGWDLQYLEEILKF